MKGSRKPKNNASKLHLKVFKVLREIFPNAVIIHEAPIKWTNQNGNKTTLFIDMVVPSLFLAFECDGKQHTHDVKFFGNFQKRKDNDAFKEEAIKKMGLTLVRIAYNDKLTVSSIRNIIMDKLKG